MSSVTDVTGAIVETPSQPQRIVCCTPYLTDAAALLGATPCIVGLSEESQRIFPERREPIGPGRRPDLARIKGLQPDLVLVDADALNPEFLRRFSTLTMPVFRTRACTFDAALALIAHLGTALWRMRTAAKIIKEIESIRDGAIQQTYGKVGPRVLCITWIEDKIHCVPTGTYADHLIRIAGGINVAPSIQALNPLTIPQVKDLDPSVILLPDYPFRFSSEHMDWVFASIGCTATLDGRVHMFPGKDLFFPGPRGGRAIQQLLNIFHTNP